MSNKRTADLTQDYDDSFFSSHLKGSVNSADIVVPLVLSLAPVRSVIDVGCGVGSWAAKFLACGVPEVVGIDGDYVNRDLLLIPKDRFVPGDLSQPISFNRRFDLAICMEVAEHLPPSRAEGLVADLIKAAPAILFSAAIPGQGGTNHINEQYLSYWVKLFAAQNYVLVDAVRPAIWNDERVEYCYRQNVVIFAQEDHSLAEFRPASGVDYVHPEVYEVYREWAQRPTLGRLAKAIPGSLSRSLHMRLGRLMHHGRPAPRSYPD